MRLAVILIILFVGLAFIGGCTDLSSEDEDTTIGGAVIQQIADKVEELNPPFENEETNESS